MRRRRIVRPVLRPGMRPRQKHPVHPLLVKANKLFENGEYLEAAELFFKLGDGALARNIPRAPHLFLQAGRAYLFAGENERAVETSKHALTLFANDKRWIELKHTGDRVVSGLLEHKLDKNAMEIEAWLNDTMPEGFDFSEEPMRIDNIRKELHLPLTCPSCGGAVNPKDVKWVDDITAECSFCGNMVRGE